MSDMRVLFIHSLLKYFLCTLMLERPVNTHPRGKDHCTAGLQFYLIGFEQSRNYVLFIPMYWNH